MLRISFAAILIAGLLLSGTAQTSLPRTASEKKLAQQIHIYLSRLEKFGYSGAVLVAKDDRLLLETGYGLANRQPRVPARADTIFDIGSLTKQFTAAAIVLLESDSKLRVTDPISKYLKDVPPDKQGITIHQLLTHTSGLPGDFGGDYEKISRDELVRRAMASKLNDPPGERHAYSNAGYSLLAAIVELVSGQSYESFLRKRLFGPAALSSTGYTFSAPLSERLARGYSSGKDWGIGAERAAATGGDYWNLIGNGGIHSTVGDLYRWMYALERGKVLTKDARAALFRPHVVAIANYRNSGTPLHYGYGWYIWKQPSGKTLIWHLGGNGIFNAAVRHHVDERAFVIYTSNVSEFHDPDYPVPAIERMLTGQPVEMPPVVTHLKPRELGEYTGLYTSETGAVLWVRAQDTVLKIEGSGQEALSFVTSGRWQKDPALDVFNALTAEVVENSRTRMYEPMLKHYGSEVTLQGLADFEALFWKKRHDLHGGYLKTRILGTAPTRSRAFKGRTIVAIDFERGTAYREYLWNPEGKIADLGPLDSAPSSQYFPVGKGCLVRFNAAEALVASRLCIEKRKKGINTATVLQDQTRVELNSF
jgi:CubicO group peptidase (beta-lactamase class C family)